MHKGSLKCKASKRWRMKKYDTRKKERFTENDKHLRKAATVPIQIYSFMMFFWSSPLSKNTKIPKILYTNINKRIFACRRSDCCCKFLPRFLRINTLQSPTRCLVQQHFRPNSPVADSNDWFAYKLADVFGLLELFLTIWLDIMFILMELRAFRTNLLIIYCISLIILLAVITLTLMVISIYSR